VQHTLAIAEAETMLARIVMTVHAMALQVESLLRRGGVLSADDLDA
jgi:hypothetical protein